MNYSLFYFLIPILLFGILEAHAETFTGFDYYILDNEYGTKTFQTHYPFIFNGNAFVPFVNSGLITETEFGSVILNSDGSYSVYKNGFVDSQELFRNKILVKFADISDLNNWTYLNSLNNQSPSNSWIDSGFTSSKTSAAGKLDYKYMINQGKWKTQLEATNFSNQTTKVFGFDEIMDLNRDTIKFGGMTRNLDNFNGTTFDKTFLIENKADVLNLLNGVDFDFDKGFDQLYSITIIDTGVNKSRLIFDYRTSEVLLPGETLIIDPSFSSNTPTYGRVHTGSITGTACDTTYVSTDAGTNDPIIPSTVSNSDCSIAYLEYGLTGLPKSISVTNSSLALIVSAVNNGINCDINLASLQPTTATGQDLLDDMLDGDNTVLDNDSWCATTGSRDLDLGTTFDTYVETQAENSDYVAFYVIFDNMVRDASLHFPTVDYTSATLTITYSVNPPEINVNDLVIDNVGDALTINGNVTVNAPNIANITSIIYLVNGTIQITNSTIQNMTTSPLTVNFGPFYYQQTTDAIFNQTVSVYAVDEFGTYTNKTYSLVTREYAPDYFTALDPTQGLVNYTFTDSNSLRNACACVKYLHSTLNHLPYFELPFCSTGSPQ